MYLNCSCGFKEEFNKKDDLRDYQRAGWKIIGFNMKQNEPYYSCKKCEEKRKKIGIVPLFKQEFKQEEEVDREEESLYLV
jgi:uncharacterized CHY-type Zn-finger protein